MGSKFYDVLWVMRLYGFGHESNRSEKICFQKRNISTVQQFRTGYVAVSLNNEIEIINVLSRTMERSIKFSSMFQQAIVVDPTQNLSNMFLLQDDFAQEAFVCYNNGTWSKFGLFCEARSFDTGSDDEDSMQVDESS